MPLVVCSPNINYVLESPLYELAVVIGNIRCKVSWSAITSYQHIVLILAQSR